MNLVKKRDTSIYNLSRSTLDQIKIKLCTTLGYSFLTSNLTRTKAKTKRSCSQRTYLSILDRLISKDPHLRKYPRLKITSGRATTGNQLDPTESQTFVCLKSSSTLSTNSNKSRLNLRNKKFDKVYARKKPFRPTIISTPLRWQTLKTTTRSQAI